MGIRLQIGQPLADLPNVAGFRFRGVEENGDLTPCIVARDIQGMHYVVEESDAGLRPYNRLRGWLPCLKKPNDPVQPLQRHQGEL